MEAPRNKPFTSLQRFAAALGWSPLRIHQHAIDNDPTVSTSYVVTWYESGDCGNPRTDCFLQINEHPIGQTRSYSGAVYAIRYRLFTGWHEFRLHRSKRELAAEVSRIGDWLSRDWFDSLPKRRQFRDFHPECTGYTWSKVARVGPPHDSATPTALPR